jgi:hypothetical protein
MRHRADGNQQDIVDALRDMGVSVLILSQVGGGCPDLMLGWRGKNYLIEVKTPNGKLRPGQKEFFDTWRGRAFIVRSVEEAIELVKCL